MVKLVVRVKLGIIVEIGHAVDFCMCAFIN